MLSDRAKRLLTTLKRHAAIPVHDVEAIIKAQGFTPLDGWLEFHEKYAGYEEVIGRETAIWGLAHERPQWLAPRTVEIDGELDGTTWYITCADVHPSFSYRLENNGEFLGGPSNSFDIHVERLGLLRDPDFERRQRRVPPDEVPTTVIETIHRSPDDFLVKEVSDSFTRYYQTDDYLLVESVKRGKLRDAFALSP